MKNISVPEKNPVAFHNGSNYGYHFNVLPV